MVDLARLTRRDFLKLAGAGFLSFSNPLASQIKAGSTDVYGRVIDIVVTVFDQPFQDAKIVKTYFSDTVLPITDVTMGGRTTDYNRIWYGYNLESRVVTVVSILPLKPPDGSTFGLLRLCCQKRIKPLKTAVRWFM